MGEGNNGKPSGKKIYTILIPKNPKIKSIKVKKSHIC